MSHLPLLFAGGQPTCLEYMTQVQLERFIPFMVHCCPSSKTTVPSWWPKELAFSFPLKPPPHLKKNWVPTMKNIIRKCYQHYDCIYVLDFCRKLASLGNKNLYYRETGDRTEVIERNTNRLLVSVKSKNKTYDLVPPSPKKQLLLRPLPSKPPPIIDDIYLCNYCDAEFTCSRDIEEHERTEHPPKVEEQISPKERHFRSIGLVSAKEEKSSGVIGVAKARRITSNLTLKKLSSIPICTPLGKLLLANTPKFTGDDAARARVKVEQYCSTRDVVAFATEANAVRRSRRVPGIALSRNKNVWSHQYCFNSKQRAERNVTIRAGLDRESRRLLRCCKPAKTVVRRLPALPGNSTINLRKIKDYIAEEFPNERILEPPKPPKPMTIVVEPPATAQLPATRSVSLSLGNPIPAMYDAFNSRPPLAGVPSNRLPILVDANRNPIKVHKIVSPVQGTHVQRMPVQATSVQRSPVQGTIVQRTPAQATSVQRSPVQGTIVQRTPAQATSVQRSLVQGSIVQRTPVQRSPVQRTPVQRTPVQATSGQRSPVQGTIVQRTPAQATSVQRSPEQRASVTPVPKRTPTGEPEIIDLCSSDEECEILERFTPIVTTPKYGVTATCPEENSPSVDETEMAGIPPKDNNTVLYVQQFVRSRS